MKAKIFNKYSVRDLNDDTVEKVYIDLNGIELDVRQSTDGTCLIVAIREGQVSLEPRAAAIWIVVKEK